MSSGLYVLSDLWVFKELGKGVMDAQVPIPARQPVS